MASRVRSNMYRIALIFAVWLSIFSCTSKPFQQRQAERFYYQGQTLLSQSKTDAAYEKFDQSYQLSKKADDRTGIAHNLNEKAIIYTAKGQNRIQSPQGDECNFSLEINLNLFQH